MSETKKSILLLSWRDYYNPKKGGAEVFDYEILSRLVKRGYSVTWFAPEFKNGALDETKDGIRYIRSGSFFSVHRKAISFYEKNKSEYDIVLDELHGYPFFTNFYIDKPRATIIHEVAGSIWFSMMPFPISFIGFMFEKLYFKFLKSQLFICPSPSTRSDLMSEGIRRASIFIAKEGTNAKRVKDLSKIKKRNQVAFIGGIRKMKGITTLLHAFALVLKQDPTMKLYLVGKLDHSYEKEYKMLTKSLQIEDSVVLTGYIDAAERDKIMAESKFLVSCSMKEGFGLIVVEANSMGTPAITFEVNGYKDIIRNQKTGYLVKDKTAQAFANTILIASNSSDYEKIRAAAWTDSLQYNWDDSVVHFEQLITSVEHKKVKKTNAFGRFVVKVIFSLSSLLGTLVTSLGIIKA